MPRKPSSQPNELELRILTVLWRRGTCSAREIHESLADERDTRMSSTTKMLQVMVDKGLVTRDHTQRPIRFAAAEPQEATQRSIVDDLIQRAFGGATEKLILRAVESQSENLSAAQLAEIRRFIARMERGAK
jgi:predicted transcriptional regulator